MEVQVALGMQDQRSAGSTPLVQTLHVEASLNPGISEAGLKRAGVLRL